ncbi:SDR family oxidoreductase [Salicola sp. Rm-C-2C1-2]|uniref:SDR family NAD(P)-dependent oxidoreductase n=1 Tax=Salicola sp. Rm-C-2C1-2 TaxID=3141321 RepID=UPI0032E3E53F
MTKESILITGGTGKLGKRLVQHFVDYGWHVIFTSTSKERAEAMEREFPQSADKVTGLACDLTDEISIDKFLTTLNARGLRINHLVNNARSLASAAQNEDGTTSRSNFMNEYLMDVVAPYELSIALWKEQPEDLKTITNISSQYGIVASNRALYGNSNKLSPIQYNVAKAALNHLTRELAVRFAPEGIRVNAVAYGGVEGRVDPSFMDRYSSLAPNGRMLTEDEIPGPVAFLVSQQSSSMTGQVIQADGGWTIW